MKKDVMLVAIGIAAFIAGLRICTMWSGGTSKVLGFSILIASLVLIYRPLSEMIKNKSVSYSLRIPYVLMGIFLIVFDLSFNFLFGDDFKLFDLAMILSGVIIIFLNTANLGILKLSREFSNFISLFLFLMIMLTAMLSTGITKLHGLLYGFEFNPLYEIMTHSAIVSSAFVLSMIKPTSVIENVIAFDTFRVGIAYPCSGVQTMVIFFSSIIAYYVSTQEKRYGRIFLSLMVGVIFFYLINILRIVLIILVGYSFGPEALEFTHYNLGWILLTVGMAVYWYFILDDSKYR